MQDGDGAAMISKYLLGSPDWQNVACWIGMLVSMLVMQPVAAVQPDDWRMVMQPAAAAADVQVLVNRQTVEVASDGRWLVVSSPKLNQARLEIEVKLIKPVQNARLLDCTVLESVAKQ